MANFDFIAASNFARLCLETRLPPYLYYHSARHTIYDVVPATERLATLEGIEGDERLLLLTAAWYHDLGFIFIKGETTRIYKSRVRQHEEAGIAITRQILPGFGYNPVEVELVLGIIMATKLPQTPHNRLEEILADADLDSLGRSDYWEISYKLRDEFTAFGMPVSEADWLARQMSFLETHRYFTASANKLRQEGKEENIREIRRRRTGEIALAGS